MKIRRASENDSSIIADLIRKSIIDGCRLDHQNRPGVLSKWLFNKTTSDVTTWINNPDNITLVAINDTSDDSIVGVGLITKTGIIRLLYSLPEQHRKEIGFQLLSYLEKAVHKLTVKIISLDSTQTARSFYEKHGYVPSGAPFESSNSITCYPMLKQI